MAKDSIESLLRIGSVAPEGTPINTPVSFNEAQFVGGDTRLGQTSKKVGPSGDAAMYAGLAEIAGGVQTAISTFSDIAGREDKRKVNEVSMEMDRLNETDLTPEQKQSALDAYMKDVWTPTLGTAWRTQVANDVNKRWLSDDARDAFEENRYRQEFKTFLNRPEIRNRQQTPELAELFQKEYESRFPTAETTAWYTLKRFETTSQLIAKKIEDAQSTLAPSVDNLIQVPNKEQQTSMSLGNPDTIDKFSAFNEWSNRARLSPDIDTFTASMYGWIQEEIEKTFDEETPIEAKEQVARDLPRLVMLKAREIYTATINMKFDEGTAQALTALTTAQTNFENTSNGIEGFGQYLSSAINNLPLTNVPLEDKRIAITKTIAFAYNKFNTAIENGTDSDLQQRFPNWATMSVKDRLDAVEVIMKEWVDKGDNGERLVNAMGYTQAEIESLGFSTPQEAADKLIVENGRLMALQQPEVRKELDKNAKDRNDDITLLKQSILLSDNKEWTSKRIDTGLAAISESLGISLDTLKSAVLTKTGEPVGILDARKWLKTIEDDKEVEALNRNGMTLGNNASLNEYLNMALSLVIEGQAHTIKLDGKSENIFDVLSIENSASKFFAGAKDQGEKKSIVNAFIRGDLGKTGDDSKFFNLLRSYVSARLSKSDPEFIASVDKELPLMSQYANAIEMGIEAQQELLTPFINAIPSVTKGVKPDVRKRSQELQEEYNQGIVGLLTGKTALMLDRVPSTLIDENGTWSQESSFYFVQLQYLSRASFQKDSSDADRTQFNKVLDNALSRLGGDTPNYLQTNEGKFDLTILALIGKEYNKASKDNGTKPVMSKENFFVNRAIMLGNWAEETDLESMLQKLNGPQNRAFMDANLAIPMQLGAMQAQIRTVTASGLVGNDLYEKQIIRGDKRGLDTASAFSGQLTLKTVNGNSSVPGPPVKPTDQMWKPETLVNVLTETLGEPITASSLAKEIRMLARTIPDDEWNKLSPEDQVRAGAVAMNHIFEGNDGLFIQAMDMFFGPKGINSPALKPNENLGETKLNMLMNFIDVAGDFNGMEIPTSYSNIKTGSGPITTRPMYEGSIKNTAGNSTPKMGNVKNIQSDTPSQSFTIEALNESTNILSRSEVLPEVKERLYEIYKPRSIEGINNSGVGVANGPMFIAGALTLSSSPSNDVRTRLSLTQNWATAHGLQNDEAVMSGFNKGEFMGSVYQGETLDKLAAKRALQDNVEKPFNSTSEYIQAVNDAYIRYGGSNPLVNKERFDKWSSPGYAELIQYIGNTGNRMSMLPTYDFSNKTPNGIPYITVTNQYLSPMDPNNPSQTRESTNIIIAAAKQAKIKKAKEEEKKVRLPFNIPVLPMGGPPL